ncbi:alpha/beta hydrolase [Rhodococcus sp. 14-2470-1b]|uniref:alpha/beta hydrolase family protein n=1 Tax=unclassified Rhodococcus (in: high G+C Gram-positive bacteria) TaxID=192944 RepID=UPI000B9BDE27|nr:alpha/beta family hydrolase [Rhodococcus sp. 14-2470-1b]OZF44051.1 alpha/beta hydrolase [Rhodococcus sp. 14-2470-1b]
MPEAPTDTYEVLGVDGVRGYLHRADGPEVAALALTHGAGSDCTAKFLVDVATAWSAHGVTVLRFDLAFRQAKPSGPPHPSKSAADRESVARAVDHLGSVTAAPLVVGGHSYGGRQASMTVSEGLSAVGALLLSYPLHPPGKPEKARTAHLPGIHIPTVFVSGTKDPFGTPDELRQAIATIPAPTEFLEIDGAGHDLSAAKHRVAERSFEHASRLLGIV